MTCVIGLVHGGVVYLGGDSAATSDEITRAVTNRKVFQAGRMVIGFSGSFRLGQLLRYYPLNVEQLPGSDDEQFLVSVYLEHVRDILKAGGFLQSELGRERGGLFLLGYRGRLYTVQYDLAVLGAADGTAAIGTGAAYALGALKALEGRPPEQRITRALEISSQFVRGVNGPFAVVRSDEITIVQTPEGE